MILVAVELVLQLMEGTGFVEAVLRVAEEVEIVLPLLGTVLVGAGTGLCGIVLVAVELVPPLVPLEGKGFVVPTVTVVLPLVGMVLVLVDAKLVVAAVLVVAGVLTTYFEPSTLLVGMP